MGARPGTQPPDWKNTMRLGADILCDPEAAASREWLVTDGLGGHASSTASGQNTRREHGLLVAALRPPEARMVLLSRFEETLIVHGQRYELSTNAYPGTLHPRGYRYLSTFRPHPLPTHTWEVAGVRLTRTLARLHGEPATALLYVTEGHVRATLELRPLLAYRKEQVLQHENADVRPEVRFEGEDVVLEPYEGCPPLYLRAPRSTWTTDGHWYRNCLYERERELGREYQEDLFSHGSFTCPMVAGRRQSVLVWMGAIPTARDAELSIEQEKQRIADLRAEAAGGMHADLCAAADAFLVRPSDGRRAVLTGYPGGAVRPRDAMVALPGLCLDRSCFNEARQLLREALVPWSRSPPEAEPSEVRDLETELWTLNVAGRFVSAAGDGSFLRARLRDPLFALLDAYHQDKVVGVRSDADGLLKEETWLGGEEPRIAAQALWYNGLLLGTEWARADGETGRAAEWINRARQVRDAVERVFWSEELGFLRDAPGDPSLRPWQLLAVTLPHTLVARERGERLVGAVEDQLLTGVGLRTLAPSASDYIGEQDHASRPEDGRGGAWPCLVSMFFDAAIRFKGEVAKRQARDWLDAFSPHLEQVCLGFVSASFDGDAPHRPRGPVAHALAVAELLRLVVRLGHSPVRLEQR